jgi:hypothetical protein
MFHTLKNYKIIISLKVIAKENNIFVITNTNILSFINLFRNNK